MQFQTQVRRTQIFIHQKGVENLAKDEFMYVANTAILELRIFSGRCHFRLWDFSSTGDKFYF